MNRPMTRVASRFFLMLGCATLLVACARAAPQSPSDSGGASKTPAELADQVTELRVFLTDDANVVIGEIETRGATQLTELSVPLERAVVRFLDDGRAPDRKAADGVFTARFPMDTEKEFATRRAAFAESAPLVYTDDSKEWILRGPRDIVRAADVMSRWRKERGVNVDEYRKRADLLLQARSAADAARMLGVDIKIVPFMTMRMGAFGLDRWSEEMFGLGWAPHLPSYFYLDSERSLTVRNVGVVEDPARTYDACTNTGTPNGAWSFAHLVRELASGSGLSPEDYLTAWLNTWLSPQSVNGLSVHDAVRDGRITRIIHSWQLMSGSSLNIDKFPARLMAIVNRPDLADRIGYGGGGSAGEARLVFGLQVMDAGHCSNETFTVIFEYGVPRTGCPAVKTWQQRWRDLGTLPVGSAAYNTALEAITRDFTEHGTNPAQLPNQSSLNQLRTNEAFAFLRWQQREFRLQGPTSPTSAGLLGLVTVKQSPVRSLNNSSVLADYLHATESDILADHYVVPERYPTPADIFLGATSEIDMTAANEFWNADTSALAQPVETRRKFSLGVCGSCHGGETHTNFTHIGGAGTRSMGHEAMLSGFLTGIDVTVPVSGGVMHHYEDLMERKIRMDGILNGSCFVLLRERRIPFSH